MSCGQRMRGGVIDEAISWLEGVGAGFPVGEGADAPRLLKGFGIGLESEFENGIVEDGVQMGEEKWRWKVQEGEWYW